MIYVDSNVLVSAYLGDFNSQTAEVWLAGQESPLAISSWVREEYVGHLGLRLRKGIITSRKHAEALVEFDALSTSLIHLTMTDGMFQRAEAWLRDPACALQPGDALHVACALEHEVAAIVTFDQRFAANMTRLKLKGLKVIVPAASGVRGVPKAEQSRAAYRITPRDIAAAAKWGRIRKNEERLAKIQRKLKSRSIVEGDVKDAVDWARKQKRAA